MSVLPPQTQEIMTDPAADSTDVYAFVSPDRPDSVTLIANYIPVGGPVGGPGCYSFGDEVRYEIHVDTDGDGAADVSYQFRFQTSVRDRGRFLYSTGPILSLDSPNWNSRQFAAVTRVKDGVAEAIAAGLPCPPCNVGPLSTPDYARLAREAVHQLPDGIKVFAGQRADGGYAELNVHSIAIQVPLAQLLDGSAPGAEGDQGPVMGVWTTASRQQVQLWDAASGEHVCGGPFCQVSRLGSPIANVRVGRNPAAPVLAKLFPAGCLEAFPYLGVPHSGFSVPAARSG
jgi:Domain of unknown function (DUF4331)